jgi:hypothetical protein
MTQTDVYIGRLSDGADPFNWGGDQDTGRVPEQIAGTRFPPSRGPGYGAFSRLIDKIKRGELHGKQVEWGGWAANVSKDDILAFIDEIYRGDPTYTDPSYLPHLYPKLADLITAVRGLPDGERFALVACEL